MNVEDWQATRIRNSRYVQDGAVKPWPWRIQVQVLGGGGSGRHSLLNQICWGKLDRTGVHPMDPDVGYREEEMRRLPCSVWFDTPPSLTSYGAGCIFTKTELFTIVSRGLRECDALVLVYDVSDPRSFQVLCEFCTRCEREGISVAPGVGLPCLIVGNKTDLASRVPVEEAERLARRIGGKAITCSALFGVDSLSLLQQVVDPVIDARVQLMHESEEVLGESIRALISWASKQRSHMKRQLSARTPKGRRPTPSTRYVPPWERLRGAPPRWTMRQIRSPPELPPAHKLGDSETEVNVPVRCPSEYQLPVGLVEPAATEWPRFSRFLPDWDLNADKRWLSKMKPPEPEPDFGGAHRRRLGPSGVGAEGGKSDLHFDYKRHRVRLLEDTEEYDQESGALTTLENIV
ncbi:hypothetical protein G7046_g1976 [Stylonectria norvegica]|nr:hypothetical protein G7046_g1976 [Stylonectria norvegica]